MRRFHLLALIAVLAAPPTVAAADGFRYCSAGRQTTCVVDGDTFRWRGDTIRIENIDAPETHDPGCSAEAVLGFEAANRLIELLQADDWSLERAGGRDLDRYGRKLRRLIVGSRDAGEILIAEGLAREWTGRRGPWCQ